MLVVCHWCVNICIQWPNLLIHTCTFITICSHTLFQEVCMVIFIIPKTIQGNPRLSNHQSTPQYLLYKQINLFAEGELLSRISLSISLPFSTYIHMRTSFIVSAFAILFAFCIAGSIAQEGNPDSHYFNVTKPTPNSPYVAGQKLPLVYRVSSDSSSNSE